MSAIFKPKQDQDVGGSTPPPPISRFVTTHWTVVQAAGSSDSVCAREALATLCQTYWYPLYSFVRMQGYMQHDAQDLTQGFFEKLLEKQIFHDIQRKEGKFRSYLLAALKHFMIDEWKKGQRIKRGGGCVFSLDAQDAERRFALEPVEQLTPKKNYEQNWALALLDAVLERLRNEQMAAGREEVFEVLKFSLTGESSAVPYKDLGSQLGMPENTVKTLVRRLRQRYCILLREEVAHTLDSPDEIENEIRFLFRVLSS